MYGTFHHYPDHNTHCAYNTHFGSFYLADPAISVSVNNLYDLNSFDENYDTNVNSGVSISQVRMNFNGYNGEKVKNKEKAKSVVSSIMGIAQTTSSVLSKADTFVEGALGDGILITLLNLFDNKFGEQVKIFSKLSGVVSELNPFIASVKAVYDLVEMLYEYVEDNTKVFKEVSANNEANIMTFPAPSQQLTTSAFASFGLNGDAEALNQQYKDIEYNSAVKEMFDQLDEHFYCKSKDPVTPKFVMGESDHYVQAIFMLSEINKPTALTSYFNPAYAIEPSHNSDALKFPIPERFNYSEKTSRLFDDVNGQNICEDVEEEVHFFGSNSRKIQLNVANDGEYDLYLNNFTALCKLKNQAVCSYANAFDNMCIPLKTDGIGGEGFVKLLQNGHEVGKPIFDADGKTIIGIRLNLSKDKSNIFELQIGEKCSNGDLTADFFGASFTANLRKHFEGLTPDSQEEIKCKLDNSGQAYYALCPQGTGLYTISVEDAIFDLYDTEYRLLNSNQKSNDILMLNYETYYVVVKGKAESPTLKFSPVTDKTVFNTSNNTVIEFALSEDINTKCYALNLGRTGIYTFEKLSEKYDTKLDYLIQLKQEGSFREMLFEAKKAYLQAGIYYLLLKGDETSILDTINISFTPREISLEQVITVMDDTYFTFVPIKDGYYTFNLNNKAFNVELDGETGNVANCYDLTAGQKYIVLIKKNMTEEANADLIVSFTPATTATYHKTIHDTVVEFVTDITGYYSFKGEGIALYNKYLTLLNDGSGQNFTSALNASEKYFIINTSGKDYIVNLEGEKLTANFEATINSGENQYLKFIAPEDGYYKIEALYSDTSNFIVYSYDNLNNNEVDNNYEICTQNGYYLNEGCLYYIKISLATTDFVTISNGNITTLSEIPEGILAEVDLDSGSSYAKSYKFIPTDSGNYTFIFNRNLKKDYSIYIDGEEYEFATGANVLKITKDLKGSTNYEIKFNLKSEGNASLIFGVYRQIEDFAVYVSDRLQDNSGLVNKIAIGGDIDGFVDEQIVIGNILGRAFYSKVNYTILNTPYIDGAEGVTIDANGLLTVRNKLPQWTAFAVEVNVGRVKYGDVILDNGVSQIINFLIYVDVQDIKIFDENDNVVYNIDIAPKQTMNLTAVVFPNHAAKADEIQYTMSAEDRKYVSLESNGYIATISGLYTTPNKTYVKIYANCSDEFTVVIMVRVYAEIITATNSSDISKIDGKSAYEIILNRNLSANIDVSANVKYLKISKGIANRLTNTSIQVHSNDLTLVFESIEITGTKDGLIFASGYNLDVHFVGEVKLFGKSGSNTDADKDGRDVICVGALSITKADDHLVQIIGGNGYSFTENNDGGNGGIAIKATSKVEIFGANNLQITGGDGGNGAKGADGAIVSVQCQPNADHNKNGKDGENGNSGTAGTNGGNGGIAIICSSLTITNCVDLVINGGNGGNGGDGGNGSAGGKGGQGGPTNGWVMDDAGNGGNGGQGGNGGNGGNGGCGATPISSDGNTAIKESRITLNNSLLKIIAGSGGNAGYGGNGGNGGDGGDGGNDRSPVGHEGYGGNGGNGGDAGIGGLGGTKGESVFISNQINVCLSGTTKEDGLIGIKGYGGNGGHRGNEGAYDAGIQEVAKDGADGKGRENP